MSRPPFSPADLAQLTAAGIAAGEAERQLALLHRPPPPARLDRPCVPGDGVERLDAGRQEALHARGLAARRAGRLAKFVPASGAATRMFRSLAAVRQRLPEADAAALAARGDAGDDAARDAARFVAAAPRLALVDAWATQLGTTPAELQRRLAREPLAPLVATLLDADGFDAAGRPKALLPFHRAAEGPRTAFVEQLVEGLAYLRDDAGEARFHFTLAPGARQRFERELGAARRLLGAARLAVAFSEQSAATDTLALADDGAPARDADGRLLLRPAGHGALLANLEATAGDLVLIKNIDNVLPAARHADVARWKTILVGRLVERAAERARGDRPLRIVGVVPNRGEPGGGPYWVAEPGGAVRPQVVESSQVDVADAAQAAVWRAATHFNPVDLVCALRDPAGAPYRLADFVDPAAAFVTRKSEGGRELTVLERPGLWNGAMAGWETLFVEVPGWTFAPVKTVLDLARPEHAGDAPSAG
ncbi:MAG: DUF4301 family protein [Thermoanaerobaculia bacterium]|nr:DUF4301 family protein [Thermoanaerobaculia bacterium]